MDYYMEKLIKNNICSKKEISESEFDKIPKEKREVVAEQIVNSELVRSEYYIADLDDYTNIKIQSAILSTLKTIKNILLISFILGLIGACFCAFKVIPVILEFAEYMYWWF